MLIAGAGNLGLHTLDQLLADNYPEEIVFFDEKGKLPDLIQGRYRLISSLDELKQYFFKEQHAFVVALGQPRIRERLTKRLLTVGGNLSTAISGRAAFISCFSNYGAGTIIQPGCAVSHNVIIGRSCILHACTMVGHDVLMDDYVTIGSMVNILKGVKIGKYSTIGPNVLIYQNIRIGKNVYIAPGVVVNRDVNDNETLEP